ncbi:lantibiotic dehydratase [Mucilaginibacter mali]|uniref:Lantibiotic dehydratase n=1 Tax=Mucilaginibacter mali TaxID=2740462 RepID=A0A7D4PRM2_9SPHI|nr:lantibiotic dehydratase [Mucilaginibacter mali]QKJ28328.1 lantibiotic dehydratase [Mucilaginibacter mali]
MSYKFADHLLLRMPVKSWKQYRETHIGSLLTDPFFLAAIYVASPGFYARLARVDFNYQQLNNRELNTLKKYHNRICFRPTPFGLFSSVSLINWGSGGVMRLDTNAYKVCINPDQAYTMAISGELLNSELKDAGLFFPNPTLYRAGNEYRFVFTTLNENYKTRDYDLQSAEYSVLLKRLLRLCTSGKNKPEILQYIIEQTACQPEEAEEYFQFMAGSQLLVNHLQPNITGAEYLRRLLEKADTICPLSSRITELKSLLASLAAHQAITPGLFIGLNQKLKNSLPDHPVFDQGEQLSLILKNDGLTGSLDSNYKNTLSDALFALDRLMPQEQPKALAAFIKTFKKQFDQQCIPLLKALDPEIGVGYQARDANEKNPLLETVHIQKRPPEDSIKWTPSHRYLLDCWHKQCSDRSQVIRLGKEELIKLGAVEQSLQIQGISVLFRISGNRVIIDNAGGVNAPALLGRFTVADNNMATAARQMATEQENANPDILFAELLHLSDPHIDNINRRGRVWTNELPVTAVSLNGQDKQVQLSDLYVSVEGDKVILRSLQHNKVVIPRLTSAYNYALNKLPLFCFLADVPYQYGKTNYTLDMAQFFPGLSFYPRVEYLDSVLYLATWILKKEEIAGLEQDDDSKILAAFYKLWDRVKLPAVFSLVQGDQQLVFCCNSADDVLLFAESVKSKNQVVIKEYLQDEEDDSIISDIKGDPYVAQFNAFVYPDTEMGLTPVKTKVIATPGISRHFVLGSEWLYLKIYVPKSAISGLLLKVSALLTRTYSHGPIEKWFFIRYEDPAPHMRLRLKMAPGNLGEVLADFKKKLEKSIYQNVIREYQADTYNREVERYQAGDYELTEDLFWRSSQLVLQLLRAEKQQPEPVPGYLFALYTTRDILNVFLPGQAEQIAFTQINYQQFMLEFDDEKIAFELDKKYRELSKNINTALRDAAFYSKLNMKTSPGEFINAASALAATVKPEHYKSFLASIIHMHLNRIFIDDSRKQEMIIYYFLHKYLVSDMARKK